MIVSLSIRNLALVQELDVEFGPGLNVVTGETGAGKSVVLGAIRLLLGERADKSLIRSEERQAELAAEIDLDGHPAVRASVARLLDEAGIEMEDGPLLLRRTLSSSASRSFVNGVAVPLSALRSLGALLIDLFSPGEQYALAESSRQRDILDRAAGLADELRLCGEAWRQTRAIEEDLEALDRDLADEGELEILRHQFKEIDEADLEAGEDGSVREEHSRLAGAKDSIQFYSQAAAILGDAEPSATDLLRRALHCLQQLSRHDPVTAKPLIERLNSVTEETLDLSRELENLASGSELDPERLEYLDERLRLLQQLKRKYGPELSDVIARGQRLAAKIDAASGRDGRRDQLRAALAEARERHLNCARRISAVRQAHADKLAEAIGQELAGLDFKAARFSIKISPAEAAAHGCDRVDFLFAPNAGESAKLLGDIASSGEISRVMLAVKTVLAEADGIPVLIFDEIDANVGGTTAAKVARRLRALGAGRQVFCITHLPQVAAAGNRHHKVAKEERQGRTFAEMELLGQEARLSEIARMLGGEDTSSVVLEHAAGLLASHR